MLYNVVFSGQLRPGFEKSQVKQHFGDLFKLPEHMVEAIFIARRAVIKRDLELGVAKKYEQKLFSYGVIVSIESTTKAVDALDDTHSETPTTDALQLVPKDEPQDDQPQAELQKSEPQDPLTTPGLKDEPTFAPRDTASTNDFAGTSAPQQSQTEAEASYPRVVPFQFTGDGKEYFKIWIVNILLTIVTLGIYSAWAKVRNQQYFYGNTTLDGGSFEYLADPKKILIGRIIAFVLFVIYTAGFNLLPHLLGGTNPQLMVGLLVALFIGFLLVMPWIIVRSLAFNAFNSSYRNIRFAFNGSYGGAFKAFILWPLAVIPTFGLLFPFVYKKQQEFMVTNSGYGTKEFEFTASAKDYYTMYGILLLVGIVVGFILSVISGFLIAGGAGLGLGMGVVAIPILLNLMLYLFAFVFITVKTTNIRYNNTYLQQHNFNADYELGSYAVLLITNTLGVLLTLGLFTPWAKVRTARYKAQHISVVAMSDLDQFVADQSERVDAFAEGVTDIFDFDIGL